MTRKVLQISVKPAPDNEVMYLDTEQNRNTIDQGKHPFKIAMRRKVIEGLAAHYLPEHLEQRKFVVLELLRVVKINIVTSTLAQQPVQITRFDSLSVKFTRPITEIS
jgi:hypothetical protein